MELGIYSFAEVGTDPTTSQHLGWHERIQHLMEEIELADQVGLDVFAVGEHHRPDYAVSSPAVILGAAAQRTKHIKLSSAVTVLSSDDPVRVFQAFSTVDLLSSGRAEIMAGRGSFIESFPLFGYDLNLYDELFAEKLDLLIKLNEQEKVNWKGKHRPSIQNLGVYPRPFQKNLPIWIAIGGTPESIARAAKLGLPMALAIIGGAPDRFAPHVKYYKDLFHQAGHNPNTLQVGINSHTFIADTSQKAADTFFPAYAQTMSRIGRERGWPSMSKEQFDWLRSPEGSLLVGSPEQVIEKILYEHELFGHTRFLAQMTVGPMPHSEVMKSIELFGTKVAPEVKKALASKAQPVTSKQEQ
ncbi:LLM class flavin-dependent oxidoreductase [Rhodocytophaga rosea]|uniref:LLM class flavin-dependent oxidoreductase n=1 Tax=Rhodocytophaga rosea TaxID=2704465 RepID=A0A6C0GD77_9BACT|nr:LLM class flavin-dependent oxidoreductase [Rhodocytophaga rosea]QHT65921.1 LLM class flavin-dependent oxidoreductase [Rhodocytophaga rosea]